MKHVAGNTGSFALVSALARGLPALALALGLTGCIAVEKDLDATSQVFFSANLDVDEGAGPKDVFAAAVYPLYARAKCDGCHATTQTPLFAKANLDEAYANSKTRLNVANPASSVLASHAVDGHYGNSAVNLGSSIWSAGLTQWATAEKAATTAPTTGGGGSTTPAPSGELTVVPAFTSPSLLLVSASGGSSGVKNLSLGTINTSLVNLTLTFTVTDPALTNGISIGQLKLNNQSANPVTIKNIYIYQSLDATINPKAGDYYPDFGATFSPVNMTVAAKTTATLSAASALVSKADGLYIAFGFDISGTGIVAPTTTTGCKALANFTANVAPMMDSDCRSCHKTGSSGGSQWNMSTDAASLCMEALSRANTANAAQSLVVLNPTGNNGHATIWDNADKAIVINWINLEK